MSKLNEMIKRKRDQGFTLIELMIVIAVIGILAIVLVPKVGSIKTQAKGAGIDTNMRVVEGYVQSKIDRWVSKSLAASEVQNDIIAAFTPANNQLTNPFTSLAAPPPASAAAATGNKALFVLNTFIVAEPAANATTDPDNLKGTIVVTVKSANGTTDAGPIESVSLYAHDVDGKVISEKNVTIKP